MKHALIISTAGIALIIAGWLYLRGAFWSEACARASLLAQAPIGSSVDEVWDLAQKQGWIKPGARIYTNTSFRSGSPGMAFTTLSGILWHDPNPRGPWVQVSWQFDRSNRLYDVYVFRNAYLRAVISSPHTSD